MDGAKKIVAFQAKVLCKGEVYEDPLYDSDFKNIFYEEGSEIAKEYIIGSDNQKVGSKYSVWNDIVNQRFDEDSYSLYSRFRRVNLQGWKFLDEQEKSINKVNELLISSLRNHSRSGIAGLAAMMESISSMRRIYYICLEIKDTPKVSKSMFFSLLAAISDYYMGKLKHAEEACCFLNPSHEEIQEAEKILSRQRLSIMHYYNEIYTSWIKEIENLKGYQIAKTFADFVERVEPKYKTFEKQFVEYKKKDKQGSNGFKPIVHFWEISSVYERLKFDFLEYCIELNLPDDQKKMLKKQDCVALADFFLDVLDEELMSKIKNSFPTICTKEGSVYWSADSRLTAEYLCLYRDLMSHKEYRVCPICKAVFYVEGRGVTRRNCPRHSRAQIDYYNRWKNKDHETDGTT